MKQMKSVFMVISLSLLFSIQSLAAWEQENGVWRYQQEGVFVVNQWIEDQGIWYYLDENGIMLADTARNLNGVDYSFDGSGACLNPYGSDNIYTDTKFQYSFLIPSGVSTSYGENEDEIELFTDYLNVTFSSYIVPEGIDAETYAGYFEEGFNESIAEIATVIDESVIQVDKFNIKKTRYLVDDVNFDFYITTHDQNLLAILAFYLPETEGMVQEIVNSLKKVE